MTTDTVGIEHRKGSRKRFFGPGTGTGSGRGAGSGTGTGPVTGGLGKRTASAEWNRIGKRTRERNRTRDKNRDRNRNGTYGRQDESREEGVTRSVIGGIAARS